jgi:hypothetical protein
MTSEMMSEVTEITEKIYNGGTKKTKTNEGRCFQSSARECFTTGG